MDKNEIHFAGQIFKLQPCGTLYWPSENILIVSDLHLEKGSSYLKYGSYLPPYDTSETLDKLKSVCQKLNPKTILFLGDVYHDKESLNRMNQANKDLWDEIINKYKILWIEGNHDPDSAPKNIKNLKLWSEKNITFRHIADKDLCSEISGHYHPCYELIHKNQKLRRPCFLVSDNKIILPSYGAFTGGLNINDPAFETLNLKNKKIYILGEKRVYLIKE